jgi:hypothetical protein
VSYEVIYIYIYIYIYMGHESDHLKWGGHLEFELTLASSFLKGAILRFSVRLFI